MGFRKLFARHFWIIQHLKDFPAIFGEKREATFVSLSVTSQTQSLDWISASKASTSRCHFCASKFSISSLPTVSTSRFPNRKSEDQNAGNFTKTLKDPTDCSLELFPDSKSEEESYQPITGWVNASQLVPSILYTFPKWQILVMHNRWLNDHPLLYYTVMDHDTDQQRNKPVCHLL